MLRGNDGIKFHFVSRSRTHILLVVIISLDQDFNVYVCIPVTLGGRPVRQRRG